MPLARLILTIAAFVSATMVSAPAGAADVPSLMRVLTASAGVSDAIAYGNCEYARDGFSNASCRLRSAANLGNAANRLAGSMPASARPAPRLASTAGAVSGGPLTELATRCRGGNRDACNALAVLTQ